MADNRALFYAIAGIFFMSMVVPMVLHPLPVNDYAYAQGGTDYVAGMASASLNNPPMTCIDHDGDDIYTKSYVTYGGIDYVDACSGSKVNEMVCVSGNNGKLEKSAASYPCAYGCENGACILR